MNLYQEILLDHFKHPRNRGVLAHADFSSGQHNPSCGDSVSIQATVHDGKIADIVFEGKGCVISLAAASLLTEAVKGKLLSEIAQYDAEFMQQLIGMQLGPNRLQCAMLPLQALQVGIRDYAQ